MKKSDIIVSIIVASLVLALLLVIIQMVGMVFSLPDESETPFRTTMPKSEQVSFFSGREILFKNFTCNEDNSVVIHGYYQVNRFTYKYYDKDYLYIPEEQEPPCLPSYITVRGR